MCTGSQGEAHLAFLDGSPLGNHRTFDVTRRRHHRAFKLIPSLVMKKVFSHTINRLLGTRCANVIYDTIAPVHVSGHASQEEMKLMMHLTQPDYFIPIHGELRQLKQHAKLAHQRRYS